MEHAFAQSCLDDAAGDVAGTHDGIIGVARHAEPIEYPLHRRARPRRVGDQDHRATLGAKARERIASRRKGGNTVVHHAPDVAKKDVIVARERGKLFDDVRQGSLRLKRVQRPARTS